MKTYTEKEVIQLINELLQYPDQLMDAINNENTNWSNQDLYDLVKYNDLVKHNEFTEIELREAEEIMMSCDLYPKSQQSAKILTKDSEGAYLDRFDLKRLSWAILVYTK